MAGVAEKPSYLNILLLAREGKVVPFFGAGASMAPPATPTGGTANLYAPSASVLAKKLATEFGLNAASDPALAAEISDLAKVTSYADATKARTALRYVIHRELSAGLTLGPIHRAIADLSDNLRLIVTTNYDTLLETAMGTRPFHLVVQGVANDDPPGERILWWPPGRPVSDPPDTLFPAELKLDPQSATAPIIYKLHGSVLPKDDCFVISEGDYVDFLHRMAGKGGIPVFFSKYIRSRSLLFVGYSLADWNVRVLLRSTFFSPSKAARELPHWAVNYGVKPLEKVLWEKRGIQVFDMTADEFAAGLEGARTAAT
ncbi:MAG: SIR2 family protein [Bryobacteraceae bacterium]